MTLEEQKQVMLNILLEFAQFCDKHNLIYYLDAGTLIGAVRHKGFIPWDDDIDVNMPQKDYDRFIELTRKTNGYLKDHIQVEYPENTIYPFLKIADNRTILVEFPQQNPMEVGVYIDVFPKYGVMDKSWKSRMICHVSQFLGNLHWFCHYSVYAWTRDDSVYGASKKLVGKLLAPFFKAAVWPIHLQDAIMHHYAKHHPLDKCRYVTTLTNGEFRKLAPKECFNGFQLMEFEGHLFKCPTDYDTYLHCLYPGDYMQLPPEDKRDHHLTIVYWKS